MLLISDRYPENHHALNKYVKLYKFILFNTLIFLFAFWHICCIIVTSGSFTFLCQPLRDVLHKLRMTHKKVPAVQLLIIALLYQTQGETSS